VEEGSGTISLSPVDVELLIYSAQLTLSTVWACSLSHTLGHIESRENIFTRFICCLPQTEGQRVSEDFGLG